MVARNIIIMACCLTPSIALAVQFGSAETNEIMPTPENYSAQASAPSSVLPDGCANAYWGTPTKPWWYWWHPYRGREQHFAYLPPLPGHYYFRPYSVSELRVQREAISALGGDPRNPYGRLPVDGKLSMNVPTPAAKIPLAQTQNQNQTQNQTIIKWPALLLDQRFAEERAKVEAPYMPGPNGQVNVTAMDYQNMVNAAGHMRAILLQMDASAPLQDLDAADKFLDRLSMEARRQAQVKLAELPNRQYSPVSPAAAAGEPAPAFEQGYIQPQQQMPIPPLADAGFWAEQDQQNAKTYGPATIGLPQNDILQPEKPFEPDPPDEEDNQQ